MDGSIPIAADWVLDRLDEHGQDDVARAYMARVTAAGVAPGKHQGAGYRHFLARPAVARPPGIYVPVVVQPRGVARCEHSLSAAMLVRVSEHDDGPLPWRHAELADEVARRFIEATGFRLTRRLVIGTAALRRQLPADDLRSAEAGMLLFALLALEARLRDRRDAPVLGERRVVVTGNLMNPRSPEGQDVVVGPVDGASLAVKLEAARAALGPGDLIIIPRANEAPELAGGPRVATAGTVANLVTALTAHASLRPPPSWSLERRAVVLRERLLAERLDAAGLRAIAHSATRLQAETPAHESEVCAALEAVLATVALQEGDVSRAEERLSAYEPGTPGFENFGPELRSHLIRLRAEALARRGDPAGGLRELDKVGDAHIPEREEHLSDVERVELLAQVIEVDRAAGRTRAEREDELRRALRRVVEFAHVDRVTLARCQELVAAALQRPRDRA